MYLKVSKCIRNCPNVSESVQMYPKLSKCIRKCPKMSEVLESLKMYLESVEIINIVEIRTCCMIKCWQPILNSHQACAMNSTRIFQQWTP